MYWAGGRRPEVMLCFSAAPAVVFAFESSLLASARPRRLNTIRGRAIVALYLVCLV